ncbi:unnamed protein product [Caenorhabditis nigoni]
MDPKDHMANSPLNPIDPIDPIDPMDTEDSIDRWNLGPMAMAPINLEIGTSFHESCGFPRDSLNQILRKYRFWRFEDLAFQVSWDQTNLKIERDLMDPLDPVNLTNKTIRTTQTIYSKINITKTSLILPRKPGQVLGAKNHRTAELSNHSHSRTRQHRTHQTQRNDVVMCGQSSVNERNQQRRRQLTHPKNRSGGAGLPFANGAHQLGGEFADADRRGGHLQQYNCLRNITITMEWRGSGQTRRREYGTLMVFEPL